MEEFTVTFQKVEPEPEFIDFQGVHFPIFGALAWFYRLFRTMKCIEAAEQELYPWLIAAKNAWVNRNKKSGIDSPINTAVAQNELI